MESTAKQGNSPVDENSERASNTQSTSGHEESWRKDGGPSPKAKYDHVTDRV